MIAGGSRWIDEGRPASCFTAFRTSADAECISGEFFPVTIVPGWLQAGAAWNPLTYALSAMRGALLEGQPPSALAGDLGRLALFAAVLIPLSMAAFSASLTAARRRGSLGQY